MSKDPAILFYTQDFLVGTMMMSDEQVGQYIRLLCLQHQKGGYLTYDDIDNIIFYLNSNGIKAKRMDTTKSGCGFMENKGV